MKFQKLNLFLNKIKQTLKTDANDERVSEEYQKMKKEHRPLKANRIYRPGEGENRDISAI